MGRAGRVGWLLGLVFAEHERLADAVAGAGEFDEPFVVDDAVDDRGGEFVVGEDRAPLLNSMFVVRMMLRLSYELAVTW